MKKRALVLLAEGFEEVEAVTPVDYLRRCGVEVVTASITGQKTVRGARGIPITADALFGEMLAGHEAEPSCWDAVILPGGMPGASNLAASGETAAFLKAMAASGKITAAICASPALVLAPLGILRGKRAACYPGMETEGALWCEDRVAVDGSVITSRGPGTAADFSLALIDKLSGPAEAEKLAASTLLRLT